MSGEVDQILSNALAAEIREHLGEDVFISQTMILILVERPPGPNDPPDTPRVQLRVKTLQPIQPTTAIQMLAEAATIVQQQKLAVDENEERNKS